MDILKRLNNIYVIDTKMWNFDHYMSAYLVEGREIALIDTGLASRFEVVRAGIKAHGFSIRDISHIFITHEHGDHGGNVAPLLKESPKAHVYIHPVALDFFTKPDIKVKETASSKMITEGGTMEPVPSSRIRLVKDGDVYDLGKGEKLRISYTPGHQPGGIIIFEEKNQGLFINDLVGNCFMDANSHYPLNSKGSDPIKSLESLRKLVDIPVKYLYLGHYGICNKPKQVIDRAIKNLEQLLIIGKKYMNEGKPELIADKVYEMLLPELEKLRLMRGEGIYQYAAMEHAPMQSNLFALWCKERVSELLNLDSI